MSGDTAAVRRSIHTAVAVLSVVVGMVPCVIFPDLVVPTHQESAGGFERLVFELLAHPPTYMRDLLHIFGGYSGFFRDDGFPEGIRSFATLAVQHVAIAIPFWFFTISGAVELMFATSQGIATWRKRV